MIAPSSLERVKRIAELNDKVRKMLKPGGVLATPGVTALGTGPLATLLHELATYDRFDGDTDPYGERDFGAITIGSARVFWKIDYYTLDLRGGCETPWNAASCQRVLTLMLAEEY